MRDYEGLRRELIAFFGVKPGDHAGMRNIASMIGQVAQDDFDAQQKRKKGGALKP